MSISQKTKLSMIPTGNTPVIHVNQGDIGDDRLIFDIGYSSSGSAVVQGTTPSGVFSHSATIDGQTVVCDLYEDMTLHEGDVVAQIVLTEGADRIGSQDFILRVQEKTYDSTAI